MNIDKPEYDDSPDLKIHLNLKRLVTEGLLLGVESRDCGIMSRDPGMMSEFAPSLSQPTISAKLCERG